MWKTGKLVVFARLGGRGKCGGIMSSQDCEVVENMAIMALRKIVRLWKAESLNIIARLKGCGKCGGFILSKS